MNETDVAAEKVQEEGTKRIASGETWGGWKAGELQIHFIQTGSGESIFYIFPDGTTMLCDCGDFPAITRIEYAIPIVPGPERLSGDWIARYVRRAAPRNAPEKDGRTLLDYWFLSHYHDDHCGTEKWQCIKEAGARLPGCFRSGLALAAEELSFATAIDRAWPEKDAGVPPRPRMVEEHIERIYKALQERDGLKFEQFRLGADDQIAQKRAPGAFPGFRILNITGNGKILCRDGSIRDLCAYALKQGNLPNENCMSLGFLLTYGKFTFYSAGDFSGEALQEDGSLLSLEDALAAELPQVDAAKINHHGFRCMTERIVQALSARTWFACIANTRQVSQDCLGRISNRKLYPGRRTIFPGVFADSRAKAEASAAWFGDIAPETIGKGCHCVITVPPGGEHYTVTCIDASDEAMRIKAVYSFCSGENRGGR